MLLRLAGASDDTTAVIGTGPEGAWVHLEYAFDELPDDELEFVPAGLLRFADERETFWLSSGTLDSVLAATWQGVASRAESRGRDVPAEDLFAAVVEYLDGEESAVFASGVAIVARGAAFRGAKDWKHGPMPFAAGALATLPTSAAEGEQFVREITRLFAEAVGGAVPKWEPADLGLGVPTHALRLDTIPALAALALDWDFRPHWFFIDRTMVVSTDPQLSKDLQRRAAKQPEAPAERLCEWLHCPGQLLVDGTAGLGRWVPLLGALGVGKEQGIKELTVLCKLLSAASQHVERIERKSTLIGKVLRERSLLRLRAPK
jgi:hypothetical protein